MKRLCLLLPLAACIAGCPPGPPEPPLADPKLIEQARAVMATAGQDGQPDGGYNVQIRLAIGSVEAPIGTISDSEELWSYLDEERVRPLGEAGLGRNGIRVGVGKAQTWTDLAAILQKMTGRPLNHNVRIAELGKPLPLKLKEGEPLRTIFLSHDDRTLSGSDYPPGDYVLAVSFSVDPDDRSKTMLTAVPQVHSSYRPLRYEKDDAGYAVVQRPVIYSFFPLAFQLRMPQRDFLLIGPNAEARRPSSVGNSFFISTRDGMQFETIYVLIPELDVLPAR